MVFLLLLRNDRCKARSNVRPERILLAGSVTGITVPALQRSFLTSGRMFDERSDVPCTVRFRSTEGLALKSPQACRVHLCGVDIVERYHFERHHFRGAAGTWYFIGCAINDRELAFRGAADMVRTAVRSYSPMHLNTVVGYSFEARRGYLFTFAYWSWPTDGPAASTFVRSVVDGNYEMMLDLVNAS